jgi:hypothetical protein
VLKKARVLNLGLIVAREGEPNDSSIGVLVSVLVLAVRARLQFNVYFHAFIVPVIGKKRV